MNALERFDTAAQKVRGNGTVGGEHEFFNETVSDVALAARDVGHALLVVEFDDRLGKIEVDGTALIAARVEKEREFLHVTETGSERSVTPGHFRVTLDDFVDLGV